MPLQIGDRMRLGKRERLALRQRTIAKAALEERTGPRVLGFASAWPLHIPQSVKGRVQWEFKDATNARIKRGVRKRVAQEEEAAAALQAYVEPLTGRVVTI